MAVCIPIDGILLHIDQLNQIVMPKFFHDFELGFQSAERSSLFVIALDGDQTPILVFAQIDSIFRFIGYVA